MDGVRRRGSSVCRFWWAQSMDLEMARAASIAGPVAIEDDGEEEASTGTAPLRMFYLVSLVEL